MFPKSWADRVQRLRVPSGFLLAAVFVWAARPTWVSLLSASPLWAAGLALRAWAAGHLRKNTALTVSGPYAYLRNPLYAGTLLTAAGFAVAANSPLFGAVVGGGLPPRLPARHGERGTPPSIPVSGV